MSEVSQTRPSYKVNHARVVPMLDIRATGRNAVALPYSYLEMVQYKSLRGSGAHVCNLRGSH